MCLTFVRLEDVDEALTRFDGFPASRRDSVVELGQWAPPPGLELVVADRHGDGVLLVQAIGYHGSRDAVVERLSAGTVAASVFWNINMVNRLVHAVDGRVLAGFEFVGGPVPDLDLLAGLDFTGGRARDNAMVFLERVSGARIMPEWFEADHPASVIVPPSMFERTDRLHELLPGFYDHRWSPESRAGDALPPTAVEVLRARAAMRSRTLREAADLVASRVSPPGVLLPSADGVAAETLRAELLREARESFRAGVEYFWEPYEDDDDEPTGGGLDDLLAEQSAADDAEAAALEARQRAHGWAAVRGRLLSDPLEALRATLTQAQRADPAGWPELQREVIALLRAEE